MPPIFLITLSLTLKLSSLILNNNNNNNGDIPPSFYCETDLSLTTTSHNLYKLSCIIFLRQYEFLLKITLHHNNFFFTLSLFLFLVHTTHNKKKIGVDKKMRFNLLKAKREMNVEEVYQVKFSLFMLLPFALSCVTFGIFSSLFFIIIIFI